jgi:hypothetical protein
LVGLVDDDLLAGILNHDAFCPFTGRLLDHSSFKIGGRRGIEGWSLWGTQGWFGVNFLDRGWRGRWGAGCQEQNQQTDDD